MWHATPPSCDNIVVYTCTCRTVILSVPSLLIMTLPSQQPWLAQCHGPTESCCQLRHCIHPLPLRLMQLFLKTTGQEQCDNQHTHGVRFSDLQLLKVGVFVDYYGHTYSVSVHITVCTVFALFKMIIMSSSSIIQSNAPAGRPQIKVKEEKIESFRALNFSWTKTAQTLSWHFTSNTITDYKNLEFPAQIVP